MKKDIVIPVVEKVHIAIAHEWNEDFSSMDWMSYLINELDQELETVFVMTRGKHPDGRITSTLRHGFKKVAPKSAEKIELVMEDTFSFRNEFLLSYYLGNTLYDKTFVAEPHQISAENLEPLPIVELEGIML